MILCAVFFFFFIVMIAFESMSGEQSVSVKKNSVLTINLKTDIIDSPTEEQQSIFNMNKKNTSILIYDALEAVRKAKNDDNIKGISIEVDNLNAGITQIDDLRAAIQDFKKSGKFVYAYEMALQQRRPKPGLLLHHDRGSQYTGARYRAKAEAAKIQLSMSRPGLPYDNAMAESFFATLKLELMDDKPFETRDAARAAVFEYVELFYNRIRMHSALGYRAPMQAERDYQTVRTVS